MLSQASRVAPKMRQSQIALAAQGPLPIDWRKEKMSRNGAIAQRILPETEEQDPDEMIDVYLRYTRPENTRCRDFRTYIYEQSFRIKDPVVQRPAAPRVFGVDTQVLSTMPDDILGVKPQMREELMSHAVPEVAKGLWKYELLTRRLKCDIYRMAFRYFDGMDLNADLDPFRMNQAARVCTALFGSTLSVDEVRTWAMPAIALTGETREFYAEFHQGLESYSLDCENRFSLLCFALPDNFTWTDQEGNVVEVGYPCKTWGLRPCLLMGNQGARLSAEDAAKAREFAIAICCGVLEHHANGMASERLFISSLVEHRVIPLADNAASVEAAEGGGVVDEAGDDQADIPLEDRHYVLPRKKLMEHKEVLNSVFRGYNLSLTPAARVMLAMSTVSDIDKHILSRFKAAVPSRKRTSKIFASEELSLKRQRQVEKSVRKKGLQNISKSPPGKQKCEAVKNFLSKLYGRLSSKALKEVCCVLSVDDQSSKLTFEEMRDVALRESLRQIEENNVSATPASPMVYAHSLKDQDDGMGSSMT